MELFSTVVDFSLFIPVVLAVPSKCPVVRFPTSAAFQNGFPCLENLISGEFEKDRECDCDTDGDLLAGLANKDVGRSRVLDHLSDGGNGRAKVWSEGGLEEPSVTEADVIVALLF